MSSILKLVNVGKKYIISHEKDAMVRRIFPSLLRLKRQEEFWALKNLDLEVKNGECLGVIGRNGAGKSTLLNLLAGITFPTQGLIEKNGRVSAILSLGAGFSPELTGEENIYLNASILGLGVSEINDRLKKIVEFSELNNFIDAFLKTYSTGMCLRLGFSIAIHADFDILLLDEILTVGDLGFQKKCLNKLIELRKENKTLIMVSQSLGLLNELCDRVLLLEKGRTDFIGKPQEAAARYRELVERGPVIDSEDPRKNIAIDGLGYLSRSEAGHILSGWHTKFAGNQAEIEKVRLLDGNGKEKNIFNSGADMSVAVDFKTNVAISRPHFGVAILREGGIYCYGPNTKFDGIKIDKINKGDGCFRIDFKDLLLNSGKYAVSVGIWDDEEKSAYTFHNAYYSFEIISETDFGLLNMGHIWKFSDGILEDAVSSTFNPKYLIKDYIDNNWQRDYNCDILNDVMLTVEDGWHRNKDVFKVGEKFVTSLSIKAEEKIVRPIIWSAIFGKDGLCCQGEICELTMINKGRVNIDLVYPKLKLLPRIHPSISSRPQEYIVVMAVFADEKQGFKKLCCYSKTFVTDFSKEDHGIVYIKHKWKLKLP